MLILYVEIKNNMGKIIITGTGRCGTSFLVHLLSALKLDTGYTEAYCKKELSNACRGGCEHTIEKPYKILKNPEFIKTIEDIVIDNDIEHVIIPIRNLKETAKSREQNQHNNGGFGGWCFDAHNIEEQEAANARLTYNMIEVLTRYDIPFTTIAFPKMVKDEKYLFKKINMSIGLEEDQFKSFNDAFNRIADVNKITIK